MTQKVLRHEATFGGRLVTMTTRKKENLQRIRKVVYRLSRVHTHSDRETIQSTAREKATFQMFRNLKQTTKLLKNSIPDYWVDSLCADCAAASHIPTIIPQTPVVRFASFVQSSRKCAEKKCVKCIFTHGVSVTRAAVTCTDKCCTKSLTGADVLERWGLSRRWQSQIFPSLYSARRNMALIHPSVLPGGARPCGRR